MEPVYRTVGFGAAWIRWSSQIAVYGLSVVFDNTKILTPKALANLGPVVGASDNPGVAIKKNPGNAESVCQAPNPFRVVHFHSSVTQGFIKLHQ